MSNIIAFEFHEPWKNFAEPRSFVASKADSPASGVCFAASGVPAAVSRVSGGVGYPCWGVRYAGRVGLGSCSSAFGSCLLGVGGMAPRSPRYGLIT